MSYTDDQVAAAISAVDKYRAGDDTEVGAALAVVGLSAERVATETDVRNDMICVAHRVGASLRQIADVAGLDRKTVTAIVGDAAARRPRRGTSSADSASRRWPPPFSC